MRIGYLSTAYHTSHIIREKNLLEQEGIAGEWKLFGGGPAIVEELGEGGLELGYIGLPPAIVGMAKGAGIKCIAGGHVDGSVLVARGAPPGRGIKEAISEFSRIASPPRGSIHDVIIRYWIKHYKLQSRVVNYSWADMILDDLVDGKIRAAVGTPSLAVLAQEYAGARVVLSPSRLWRSNPSYGIVAREEYLDSREVAEFLKMHERECNFLRLVPEKAAEVIARSMNILSRGTVEKIIRLSPHYCASLSREFIASTMQFVPVLHSLGYTTREVQRGEIFHTELIDRLHPERPHY